VPTPPHSLGMTCSTLLFSNFVELKQKKEKKWHFSLFKVKIAIQGVSL
jgi:hypothetical protein